MKHETKTKLLYPVLYCCILYSVLVQYVCMMHSRAVVPLPPALCSQGHDCSGVCMMHPVPGPGYGYRVHSIIQYCTVRVLYCTGYHCIILYHTVIRKVQYDNTV